MVDEQPQQIQVNPVDRAEAVLKGMKEQTDRYEELVKRNEEAASRIMLGGGTTGNIPAQQKSESEIKKEGALEFWKGTGIDETIKKYG